MARPTAISITPTARMKVAPLTGRTFSAIGLRYIPQVVSTSKNLSSPARNAPRPSPTRRAHHADSSPFVSTVLPPCGNGVRVRQWVTAKREKRCNLSVGGDSVPRGAHGPQESHRAPPPHPLLIFPRPRGREPRDGGRHGALRGADAPLQPAPLPRRAGHPPRR